MAFRGYFALNQVEIANSSRVAAHLGMDPPTNDLGILGQAADCALTLLKPNRTPSPSFTDASKWPEATRSGDTALVPEQRELRMTGGNGASAVAYLTPARFPVTTAAVIGVEFVMRAPAANAGAMRLRPRIRFVDSTGVNTDLYSYMSSVTVAPTANPGQTISYKDTIAVPAGYTEGHPRLDLDSAQTNVGTLFVSDPVVTLSTDPSGLLAAPAPSQAPIAPGRLLYTPADGTRLYSPLLGLIGDCWSPENMCFSCRGEITYDDSWPGLTDMLGDTIYRPELAPWYSTQVPESAEFGGIWVMDVKGLDSTPAQREIIESAGGGGSAGPHRDGTRRIQFDALLVACTNAGLTHGLRWLTTQLRMTTDRTNSVLRYMAAHPGESAADPETLLRELHGVVMTSPPEVTNAVNASHGEHQQATMYRVQWEMAATRPYAYSPPIHLPVDWDEITVEPIEWVHAADCREPTSCAPMPALFAADCVVDRIPVVATPPPVCGGCLPVGGIETFVYQVPTFSKPFRTRETSVTLRITNTGAHNATFQTFWRRCNARSDCDNDQWPLQITSLPPGGELVLDGISKSYHLNLGGRKYRPFGMVATPTGAPWRPPVIDRSQCWEFVALAPNDAFFEITMALADREA